MSSVELLYRYFFRGIGWVLFIGVITILYVTTDYAIKEFGKAPVKKPAARSAPSGKAMSGHRP